MALTCLGISMFLLGIVTIGVCNHISVNCNIRTPQIPSYFSVSASLVNASRSQAGDILTKYSNLSYFVQKNTDFYNYLYSFERTCPALTVFFASTLPVLAVWMGPDAPHDNLLIILSVMWGPYILGLLLSKLFHVCDILCDETEGLYPYSENGLKSSSENTFPDAASPEEAIAYFDAEESRFFYIVAYRVKAMQIQKKIIARCRIIQAAAIAAAIVSGILSW